MPLFVIHFLIWPFIWICFKSSVPSRQLQRQPYEPDRVLTRGKLVCDLNKVGELPMKQLQFTWQFSVKKVNIVKMG